MAKITAGEKTPRRTKAARLHSEVVVYRTGGSKDKAFEVCIDIGRSKGASPQAPKQTSGFTTACEFGRNPRAALAATLDQAAKQMKKRTGAFARYR